MAAFTTNVHSVRQRLLTRQLINAGNLKVVLNLSLLGTSDRRVQTSPSLFGQRLNLDNVARSKTAFTGGGECIPYTSSAVMDCS